MSLHVNPTTAAAGALKAQKKKSAFSAAIISLLSLFLIGLILYVIALNIAVKKNPEIISYGGPPTEEVEEERAVTDEVQTKPIK